jgi:hypothetical protein
MPNQDTNPDEPMSRAEMRKRRIEEYNAIKDPIMDPIIARLMTKVIERNEAKEAKLQQGADKRKRDIEEAKAERDIIVARINARNQEHAVQQDHADG